MKCYGWFKFYFPFQVFFIVLTTFSYCVIDALHFTSISFLLDDFKPASVDTSRPAELVVGDTNEITVTVPHVQVHIK